MHEFFDLSNKCYDSYCCCPCNCHYKNNNNKCVCLTNKYREFCEEDSIILKETTNSYFNVEYIKFSICCKKLLIKLYLKN